MWEIDMWKAKLRVCDGPLQRIPNKIMHIEEIIQPKMSNTKYSCGKSICESYGCVMVTIVTDINGRRDPAR